MTGAKRFDDGEARGKRRRKIRAHSGDRIRGLHRTGPTVGGSSAMSGSVCTLGPKTRSCWTTLSTITDGRRSMKRQLTGSASWPRPLNVQSIFVVPGNHGVDAARFDCQLYPKTECSPTYRSTIARYCEYMD